MHAAVLAANTSGQQTPSAGVPVQISVAYGTTGLLTKPVNPLLPFPRKAMRPEKFILICSFP